MTSCMVFAQYSSKVFLTVLGIYMHVLKFFFLFLPLSPQELVCLCGAQERELRRAGECGELPGTRSGPLPSLPARLPATSDVRNPGSQWEGVGGACLDVWDSSETKCFSERDLEAEIFWRKSTGRTKSRASSEFKKSPLKGQRVKELSLQLKGNTNGYLPLSINLSIISSINWLVVWSIKCQKMVKNVDQCFPKPKVACTCLVLSTTQRYSAYCHRETRMYSHSRSRNQRIWKLFLKK